MENRVELHEAKSLSEFLALLRAENGDSFASLARKIGVSASTLYSLENEGSPKDVTLDKVATYAGVTREWLYALAKGTEVRPRYSRTISLLATLLEEAPPDVAEEILVVARALIAARKKQSAKGEQKNGNLAPG